MTAQYNDDDLVYVDPAAKEIVGLVEFDAQGNPISKPYESKDGEDSWRRFFPFGTMRSVVNAFRLRGKIVKNQDEEEKLDEVLPRALRDEL